MSMEIRSDLLVSQCAVMRKKSNKVLINLKNVLIEMYQVLIFPQNRELTQYEKRKCMPYY